MPNSTRLVELRNPAPSSHPLTTVKWQRGLRSPNTPLRRRLNRAIGFWLGGGLLGVGGAILGFCLTYHDPVGMTVSALWWGIYLGCFGASIGALLGVWAEQTPA
jgi:hypothetical protein